MERYLRHFDLCNKWDISRFTPFFIAGKIFGFLRADVLPLLLESSDFVQTAEGVSLSDKLQNDAQRSRALNRAAERLSLFHNTPLRGEAFAVVHAWGEEPVAEIDRSAIPWFGLRAFGVHVNGYVRKSDGLYMWLGERAMNRPASPGKLDNVIGGGMPTGLGIEETLYKEAKEEAGFSEEIIRHATMCDPMSYRVERMSGLRRDTLFIFDLELPEDVIPQNTDGEVACFKLLSLAEVAAVVAQTDLVTFNGNLVMIDFLFRHGYWNKSEKIYQAVEKRLIDARQER